ncbi:hypothetical protein ACLBXX_14750 [Microbacterium sp. C23T]
MMTDGSVRALTILGCATLLTLTGCVPAPFACPAIGWTNSLTVELAGDTSSVATMQLCTKDGCAPGPNLDSSNPLSLIALVDRDGDAWVFSTDMLALEEITVQTLAADGSVLWETRVSPDWERVGGTEQCGGPSIAIVSLTP